MRNPTRINPLMGKFTTLWKLYPDLRFGQLVENLIRCNYPGSSIVGIENSLWNFEEEQWEEAIDKMLEGEKND